LIERRSFLAALAGAFVADPERLLWIPGAKTISIPRPPFPDEALIAAYIVPAIDFHYQQLYNYLLNIQLETRERLWQLETRERLGLA
jgi:hypothetical protein